MTAAVFGVGAAACLCREESQFKDGRMRSWPAWLICLDVWIGGGQLHALQATLRSQPPYNYWVASPQSKIHPFVTDAAQKPKPQNQLPVPSTSE